jgi:hypothetical protein
MAGSNIGEHLERSDLQSTSRGPQFQFPFPGGRDMWPVDQSENRVTGCLIFGFYFF